ncbi:antibiotic biosynthesis monooxygenase [Nocardioides sp. GY 10127]|uniref:putative quinol monooxygenase n=1 Tax=Nocardioides sp. GY 10127 TaxID=2569762 RepID=UPI0010A82ED6|nr:antibiotic biosynthesis monooxygenase [Nocardioides sp. GY 10127]TIC80033.1 hypothetical protein E8D37_15490 [Nocardioides sp. GY 10127]
MSEILNLGRMTFDASNADAVKELFSECISIARAKDTGTLQYDLFYNAAGTEAVVVERYEDSAALLQHWENIGEELMDKILALVTYDGETLGPISPELLEGLGGDEARAFAPTLTF